MECSFCVHRQAQGENRALYQVIQEKEKYAKRNERSFAANIEGITKDQQYKQYGGQSGPGSKQCV